MTIMRKQNDWAIRINGDEPHVLPHAHVEFRDGYRVSVAIESVAVLAGGVTPAKRLAEPKAWIAENKAALLAEYRRLNP